jgi:hypothetical protein
MTNKLAETRDSSVKEEGRKKEEEKRGKRGKESNQGFLATRNPMPKSVGSGVKSRSGTRSAR